MNSTVLDQMLENWKTALHQQGYRVTQPRLQVMEIVASSETPLTPQDIYQRSLEMDSPPGIASVYRTLEMMDELGLIQQIHQPGGCHAIWPALDGHQHLLICTSCGKMRIVDGNEEITAYLSNIEQQTGYQVDEHWLQLFGVCQDCS
ncbi:MAG: Fur family transcriptional regulator [Anaerolineales bacterium]|jgi:Fur family ferric uptake transcriptional regulator